MTSPSGQPGSVGSGESSEGLPRVLSSALKLVAPTAVITALLFYFGWARTDAAAEAAGLDQSLFGYSTNDYLLRSVSPLFKPFGLGLLAVVLIAVAASAAGRFTRHRISAGGLSTPSVNRIGWALLALAAASITAGAVLLGSVRYQRPAHTAAVLIMAGAVALWAAVSLADIQRDMSAPSPEPHSGEVMDDAATRTASPRLSGLLSPQRGWLLGAVAALVLVGLFAVVLRLAFEDGRGSINRFAAELNREPMVVITSSQPLDISLPGVDGALLPGPQGYSGAPRFRYEGMHLLMEANDRLFLVTPDFGRPDRPWTVVVVPHTADLRLDFVCTMQSEEGSAEIANSCSGG